MPADEAVPDGYPSELTEIALLDDGTPVEFRAILPADGVRLERLFYRLSPESLYLRFFAPVPRPNRALIEYLVHLDYVNRLALVAVIDDEVVGVARYDRLAAAPSAPADVDPHAAEVAVIVEDAWQGRGIATRLLWRLSAAALDRGVTRLTASVLAQNRTMLGLLRVLGPRVDLDLQGSEYAVTLHLTDSSAA